MAIHYYFTIFPMEALIASELEPENFGSYMAMGTKKSGASEQLIFAEVTEESGDYFDWDYAKEKCVSHADGRQKSSVYLSVYRVLENLSSKSLGALYLTTKDGRSLKLDKGAYTDPEGFKDLGLYKELCPVNPLVVSKHTPEKFAQYMTSPKSKVNMPALVFSDLKVIHPEDIKNSGNIGDEYDKNLDHLEECFNALNSGTGKDTKIVDRSYMGKFSFQLINTGIYIQEKDGIVLYKMPSRDELKKEHYDWGRSAQIF